MAKDSGGVVWVLDVQIVSALAGLGGAHRNKIKYYKGNSILGGNIAERFGVEAGPVRVLAISLSWKGAWWYKAVAPLIALGISQKTLNDLTYRAMRGSLLNVYSLNKITYRAGHCITSIIFRGLVLWLRQGRWLYCNSFVIKHNKIKVLSVHWSKSRQILVAHVSSKVMNANTLNKIPICMYVCLHGIRKKLLTIHLKTA